MTQEQLVDVIFAKVKHELHNNFWYEIGTILFLSLNCYQ